MAISEYLAISAIFLVGFYLGFKVKEGVYSLRNYILKNFSKSNKSDNI